MNKKLKNNGITLISLVITIIIMLILVGVSITLAVNGGLFEYAGNAVGDTRNAMEQEQNLIDDIIENYIKKYIPDGLKVGDYVNYTPSKGTYKVADGENGSGYTTEAGYQEFTTETGENALKWRVWSIDEEKGTVELISDKAIQKLYLKGADGYNHGVDILNDLCETLYSKKDENGKSLAIARSINIEDIKKKTTYKVEEDSIYKKYYDKTYPLDNIKYPKIYANELGSTANGLGETGNLLTESEGVRKNGTADYTTYTGFNTAETLNVTYTYYEYKLENFLNGELGVNTLPLELINLNTTYWLASRCVVCSSEEAKFGIRAVGADGVVGYGPIFWSYGGTNEYPNAIRPVVSLAKGVSLSLDKVNDDGSVYWNIEF